jgi:hypothetical protein
VHVRFAVASIASAACATAIALVACVDLFHGTHDIVDACELDASSPGCGDSGPTSFCALDSATAHTTAQHACAWLGACSGPLGSNALGACMVDALLAYDCSIHPGRKVKGATFAYFSCMAHVTSCSDVDACVWPKGTQGCSTAGNYTACGNAVSSAGVSDFAVRLECFDAGRPFAESCTATGQTCLTKNNHAVCAGDDAGAACALPACSGTRLVACNDAGINVGVDCASYGAQQCTAAAGAAACLAESTDAGTCTPSLTATCVGNVAVGCPSGVVERVDCAALLGAPACNAGPLPVPWDVSSACYVSAATCSGDSCNGTTVKGCARGAPFTVDCAAQGLGSCQMTTTDLGTQQHAACGHP